MFEDAGNNFFNGQLDPRVLVSYYPDLRGNLFDDGDNVDLFAGVAEHMPKEASVEDISESPLPLPLTMIVSILSPYSDPWPLDVH